MNLQFYSDTRVNGYGFMIIILKPIVPVGYNFFYLPMNIKYNPNSTPNRVFIRQVSDMGYQLTSLIAMRLRLIHFEREPNSVLVACRLPPNLPRLKQRAGMGHRRWKCRGERVEPSRCSQTTPTRSSPAGIFMDCSVC
jgi:hypothetical protein